MEQHLKTVQNGKKLYESKKEKRLVNQLKKSTLGKEVVRDAKTSEHAHTSSKSKRDDSGHRLSSRVLWLQIPTPRVTATVPVTPFPQL